MSKTTDIEPIFKYCFISFMLYILYTFMFPVDVSTI